MQPTPTSPTVVLRDMADHGALASDFNIEVIQDAMTDVIDYANHGALENDNFLETVDAQSVVNALMAMSGDVPSGMIKQFLLAIADNQQHPAIDHGIRNQIGETIVLQQFDDQPDPDFQILAGNRVSSATRIASPYWQSKASDLDIVTVYSDALSALLRDQVPVSDAGLLWLYHDELDDRMVDHGFLAAHIEKTGRLDTILEQGGDRAHSLLFDISMEIAIAPFNVLSSFAQSPEQVDTLGSRVPAGPFNGEANTLLDLAMARGFAGPDPFRLEFEPSQENAYSALARNLIEQDLVVKGPIGDHSPSFMVNQNVQGPGEYLDKYLCKEPEPEAEVDAMSPS